MRTIALILTALSLLSACAGSATRAEPKRLLLRYEGPAAQITAAERPRWVVRTVVLPDYLDRREILRRVNGNEVEAMEGAIWAERPAKAITRYVAEALAAQREDVTIEPYTTTDGRTPDAVLAITLEGFEPDAQGAVHLRGQYVYAQFGRASTLSGRFEADAPGAALTPEASITALQSALTVVVNTLAAALPKAP